MKNLYLRVFILVMSLVFVGCTAGIGGTHTGSGLTSEEGSGGGVAVPPVGGGPSTPTPDKDPVMDKAVISLFSNKTGEKDYYWLDTGAWDSLNPSDHMKYRDPDSDEHIYISKLEFDGSQEIKGFLHSHYQGSQSHRWQNYIFTGAMKVEDPKGSIGITFYSDYPQTDTYYRIRRFYSTEPGSEARAAFNFSAHPNETRFRACNGPENEYKGGKGNSGLYPEAGKWYRFEVKLTNHADKTEIEAWVWEEGKTKSDDYKIHCFDHQETRITSGTAGVWMGTKYKAEDVGQKYYKDFKVTLPEE